MAEETEVERERAEQHEVWKAKSFNWLSRDNRGSTYISYNKFNHLPATSFEFGADGFAAACNVGGELLHLSAPSETKGLIFARGDFSSSLYACLARAQMEYGGYSTFGLKVARDQPLYVPPERINDPSKLPPSPKSKTKQNRNAKKAASPPAKREEGSSFRLGQLLERGCFNYRWPVNEYSLLLNDSPQSGLERETGTCIVFSFVKDGVYYQVMRLEQGCQSRIDTCPLFPLQSKIVLSIGGPIYLQSLEAISAAANSPADPGDGGEPRTNIAYSASNDCLRIVDEANDIALEAKIYQLGANGRSYASLELRPATNLQGGLPASQNTGSAVLRTESTTDTSVTLVSAITESSDAESARVDKCPVFHASAELHAPSAEEGGLGKRSATFVAAIRLVDGENAKIGSRWPDIPSSEIMYHDAGAEPSSLESVLFSNPNATGAMWETISLGRELRTDLTSEFTEISLIGRCLEKILQVDLVPGAFQTDDRTSGIVSNAFTHPTVNFRSLFWKVRFLIKVHRFLSELGKGAAVRRSRSGSTSSIGTNNEIDVNLFQSLTEDVFEPPDLSGCTSYGRVQMFNIARSQCQRIRDAIVSVVLFLGEFLSTSEELFSTPLLPFSERRLADDSDYYYIMITIWYIVQALPTDGWEREKSDLKALLCDTDHDQIAYSCIPPDNYNFGTESMLKIPLLQWYHYGSMLQLAEAEMLPPCWNTAAMRTKVYGLSNAARIASTGRVFANSRYSVEDEIVDRLAFLACELSLEKLDAGEDTVASASIRRVRQREFTKQLNPGSSYLVDPKETCGPWEVHALCHNSRLNVLTLEHDSLSADDGDWRATQRREAEIELYKGKLYRFLNSEATIVSCWERSHITMRSGWLRSEATAVLGSTLLDIHSFIPVEPKIAQKIKPRWKIDKNSPNISLESYSVGVQDGLKAGLQTGQVKLVEEAVHMRHLMVRHGELLEKLKSEDILPIDWTSYAPPRHYHPEDFVNSLEDTPHLFRPPFTDRIFIPSSLVHDVKLTDGEEISQIDLQAALGHAPDSVTVSDIVAFRKRSSQPSGGKLTHRDTAMPTIYHYQEVIDEDLETRFTDVVFNRRKSVLVRALYDSLVDQSVQHRIISVKSVKEKLIRRILTYVMHPEVATCLSNHVRGIPFFSCHQGPTWTTSVTLSSWRPMSDAEVASDARDALHSGFIRLPKKLQSVKPWKQPGVKNSPASTPKAHCLFVSSIVLSTNAFGDFSKCTFISEKIDGEELVEFVWLSNGIWQTFIHQPHTARCLVFLQALGMQCARLSEQYKATINEFASVVHFQKVFFLDEVEWYSDRSSISEFQLSLWSLDSLYKVQKSLDTTLRCIQDARKELMSQIEEGARNRSPQLQRLCQEYVTMFEGSFAELTKVSEDLNSGIALAVRFKEALAATLALRDSRIGLEQNKTSISQNNTIQKLTYLTIGYLPMGLMATIFAIPDQQNVVFQSMGQAWFIGAILIMSAATYAVAAWIGDVINFLRFPSKDKVPAIVPKDPPNLWRILGPRRPEQKELPR